MIHAKIFHHFEDLVETGVYCCEGTGTLEGGLHFFGGFLLDCKGFKRYKDRVNIKFYFFPFLKAHLFAFCLTK
jgi:hypothetical protein